MKSDLAQLFVAALGIGLALALTVLAVAGLCVMGRWAWELFDGWRRAVYMRRTLPPGARLIDAEMEGWLEDWDWPRRRRAEAHAPDQTGELELPRVGVAA